MSTSHKHDPQKGNAWAKERDWAATELLYKRFRGLQAAAHAVIAAGRPSQWRHSGPKCDCKRCTAWDELAELLKETP